MKKGFSFCYVLYLALLIGGFVVLCNWSGEYFSLGQFINPNFIFVIILPFMALLATGDFTNFFKGFKAAFVKNISSTIAYEKAWKNYFVCVLIVSCLFAGIEIAFGIWKVMLSYPEIKSGADLQNGNALLNEIVVFLHGGFCTLIYGFGIVAILMPIKSMLIDKKR